MSGLWLVGYANEVPADETSVTTTIAPLRDDGQEAEQSHAPDFNEFDSDNSGELTGLAMRTAGSATTDTEKSAPFWDQLASFNHNEIVDSQVASSGTAARREEAGAHGHGTMQYAEGIEPVIRDGATFGNDYFVSHETIIQNGAGVYMTPPTHDNWWAAVAQGSANDASRDAFQASQYSAFLAATQGK